MTDGVDFRSRGFLLEHMRSILAFYDPHVVDGRGGFHQSFRDDGSVFDPDRKHLVSSSRMVFNYCLAERLLGDERYRRLWQHGLEFLRTRHRRDGRRGYAWTLDARGATDDTNYCYGLAFVLLACAAALTAGDRAAGADLEQTFELLERHFWRPAEGLYADEISSDWTRTAAYRGQNANMHMCEALLAAHDATGEARFLERAHRLSRTIVVEQAAKSDGLVWEHYRPDLGIDWDFNRDDPKHLYRPWGFQPGHQTEWAKLLLQLHARRPEAWMVDRSRALFDRAMAMAWDDEHGGLVYGIAPDGTVCDDDKYFWVQAESFAAAALLARATGDDDYWRWYERLWHYCWQCFVDHEHGAWYRLLARDNRRYDDKKSEAGAKCDYHTLGACAVAVEALA